LSKSEDLPVQTYRHCFRVLKQGTKENGQYLV